MKEPCIWLPYVFLWHVWAYQIRPPNKFIKDCGLRKQLAIFPPFSPNDHVLLFGKIKHVNFSPCKIRENFTLPTEINENKRLMQIVTRLKL